MGIFRYVTVNEGPLLDRWFELRTQIYLESGLIGIAELNAQGRYVDTYDDHSEHVLFFDEEAPASPIGTLRLVDGRRTALPVTNLFGVRTSLDAVEVSGFAVLRQYRKSFVTLGAYRLLWGYALDKAYDEIHFEIEEPLHQSLKWIGIPALATSESRITFNALNTPFMNRPEEWIPSVRARDQVRARSGLSVSRVFESPFNGLFDIDDFMATKPAVL